MMTVTKKNYDSYKETRGGAVEPNLGKKTAEPNLGKNKPLHRLGFRLRDQGVWFRFSELHYEITPPQILNTPIL